MKSLLGGAMSSFSRRILDNYPSMVPLRSCTDDLDRLADTDDVNLMIVKDEMVADFGDEGGLSPLPVTSSQRGTGLNPRKEAHKWSTEQTQRLLEMFVSNFRRITGDSERNRTIFQQLADAINEEFGTNLLGEQCDSKIRNMKGRYREIKQHNQIQGVEPKTWPYYELFERLFGAPEDDVHATLDPSDVERLITEATIRVEASLANSSDDQGIILAHFEPPPVLSSQPGSSRNGSGGKKRASSDRVAGRPKRSRREQQDSPSSDVYQNGSNGLPVQKFLDVADADQNRTRSDMSMVDTAAPVFRDEIVCLLRDLLESNEVHRRERMQQRERMHAQQMSLLREILTELKRERNGR